MARQKGFYLLLQIITVVGDACLLYCSFVIAFWLRFSSGMFASPKGIPPFGLYVQTFLLAVLVLIIVLQSKGFYTRKAGYQVSSFEFVELFKALTIGYVALMALSFVYRTEIPFSRLFMLVSWGASVVLISVYRWLMQKFSDWYIMKNGEKRRLLVIGTGENAGRLIDGLKKYGGNNFEISGIISYKADSNEKPFGYPLLGGLEQIVSILDERKTDEVILTVSNLDHSVILNLMLECERRMVSFKMVPDMFEIVASQVEIDNIDGVPLLGLKQFPLERFWNRFIKRLFDITGALFGITFGLPVFGICALSVKKESSGPVLYRQERVGEDGKHFLMTKFRTMVVDAEDKSGPVMAKENDPRCTKTGAFLRSYNLDELPQLINVLKGDMSLVGPRPERPHFVKEFRTNIPRYMSRHKVKSGMTGWAQVNGLRGNTSISERVKYDLYYMENWSIWLDIKIILMTFKKKNS